MPPTVGDIQKKFVSAGYEIYLVGGAVRDMMMGKNPTDWDFTTNATPEEILQLFPDGFYDNQFGTVGLPLEALAKGGILLKAESGKRKAESDIVQITTYRTEHGYSDSRRPDKVIWGKTIEEDLSRRDFTINAMALRLEQESGRVKEWKGKRKAPALRLSSSFTLTDPYGGYQDLQNKLIRAVGRADARFKEDALRLMRAIRIACQLQFQIEQATLSTIVADSAQIAHVSYERIRDEFFKILASDFAYEGILLLRNTNLLSYIMPEFEKGFGVDQAGPDRHHIYDVATHGLLSLKECPSQKPLVRFACLIHDIGKPDVVGKDKKGNTTFYNHEVVGAKIAAKIANRFHLSGKDRDLLVKLVRWHLFTVDENQTDSAIRRLIRNIGLENIDDLIDVRIGDRLGSGLTQAESWRLKLLKDRISKILHPAFAIVDLAVDGKDVMKTLGIAPGPKVGQILQKLFEEVDEDMSKNNRDYLLKRVKQLS